MALCCSASRGQKAWLCSVARLDRLVDRSSRGFESVERCRPSVDREDWWKKMACSLGQSRQVRDCSQRRGEGWCLLSVARAVSLAHGRTVRRRAAEACSGRVGSLRR